MSAGTLSFRGLLRAEWIGVVTLRRAWIGPLLAVLLVIGFAVLGAVSPDVDPEGLSSTSFLEVLAGGLGTAHVVLAVTASMATASGFTLGSVRSDFVADPGRVGPLVAKAVLHAVLAAASTAIGLLVALWPVSAQLASQGAALPLGDLHVWSGILAAAASSGLASLLGSAIGIVVRNPAVGALTAIGLVIVLGFAMSIAAGVSERDWLRGLVHLTPGDALSAMSGTPEGVGSERSLAPWAGALASVAWIAAFTVPGLLSIRRRDVH